MSKHQQIQQLIAIYRDLNSAELARVAAHVPSCAACTARLAAYQAMDSQLASLPDERTGAQFRPAFYARLEHAQRQGRWLMVWRQVPILMGQTAVLAFIALVFIGFWWSIRDQSLQPVTASETAVPTITPTPTLLPATATITPSSTPLPTITPSPVWQMTQIQQFTNPQGNVNGIALATDGSVLAVASSEQVQVWQTADWQPVGIWTMPPQSGRLQTLNSTALSANGDYLALGSLDYNGYVVVWPLPQRNYDHVLSEHEDSISNLAFSPNGRFLASGTANNERMVRLWQLADGSRQQQFTTQSSINDLAFAPDSATLAVATAADGVQLWSVAEGAEIADLAVAGGWVTAVALNEQIVAAGTLDGRLILWRSGETAVWQELSIDTIAVRTILFSADGNLLAAAMADGTVLLWQIKDGGLQELMVVQTAVASSQAIQLAFTAEGLLAVSGMPNGTIEVWLASQE